METDEKIFRGLHAKLKALLPELPAGIEIALPNSSFIPKFTEDGIGIPFLEMAVILPDERESTGLGDLAGIRINGVFQVSISFAKNTGEAEARGIGGQVAKHFRRGVIISSADIASLSPLFIRIIRPPSIGNVQGADAWSMLPVRVRWFCDAPNNA